MQGIRSEWYTTDGKRKGWHKVEVMKDGESIPTTVNTNNVEPPNYFQKRSFQSVISITGFYRETVLNLRLHTQTRLSLLDQASRILWGRWEG